jgi:hypothetical protein
MFSVDTQILKSRADEVAKPWHPGRSFDKPYCRVYFLFRPINNLTAHIILKFNCLQLKQFRRLSSSESKIADNYRILQNLGNRLVYVRKMYTYRTAGGNFTHDEPVWYH